MSGTIIFTCFCSAGIAVCISYIIFTLIGERRRLERNDPKEKRPPERYQYYEAYENEDGLNIDLD